ncbi:isochorismatase [Rhodococcus rhodnii]|uniref:Isochorismatase n=1 Tax=Rhodococcus rhodnii TaxID=38312 RepID=A0A6P2CIL4_9NOCA|nr:isochorismatase [Rhodococcus rhodnii]
MTADRVRADIADVLDLDPAELADADDLLDEGLDSVRVMALVERWRAAGVDVDIVDLAAEPTITAWTKLLTA